MLKITGVHTFYGQIEALKGVDLDVKQGEIVTLIGANGAGKSTLLMTICGSPRARQGAIEFEGKAITQKPTYEIMRMGIAQSPEGRRIFPRMTVMENLQMGALTADPTKFGEDIDKVFGLFPILKQRQGQRGGTLSGGEQQMLAFARALCGAPRVMLLDEPSEGIQPNIVFELGRIIGRIAAGAGMAVLLVEQNIDLALQVAHRTLVMEKGRIVHEGKPDDFRDDATLRKLLAI